MSDLALVGNGLGRKPFRTILLSFAIFIAFLIFGVIAAFSASFDAGDTADDRLVVINKINFTQSLPIAYVNRVAAIENVADLTYTMWFGGYYQEPRNFVFSFATDPESYLRVYAEDIVVPADQAAAWIERRDGVMVGREVADQYGWAVGDQVPLSTNLWVRSDGGRVYPVVVSAIYDAAPDAPAANQVLLNFEYLDEARSFGTDEIGSITVRTVDPSRNQETIDAIDAQFANSRAETETITEAAFNQAFVEQLGNIGLILIGSSSAAFVTILMIVGNAMAGAVRERTKEIAVMKTLGFTSGRIGRIVIGETILLALIGGLIGLGVSAVAVEGLKSSGVGFFGNLEMTPMIFAQGVAIMLGLGLVTGLLPAIYAVRINVIRAFGKG